MQIYIFAAEKSNLKRMSKEIRLKKGLTINLVGDADKVYASVKSIDRTYRYVVKPTDFHGVTPKLIVKISDKVKAGSPLFFDKSNKKVNFCSPVSGEITDIIRGEKRRILEVVIKAEAEISYESFVTSSARIFFASFISAFSKASNFLIASSGNSVNRRINRPTSASSVLRQYCQKS